ncbi:SDR family NAD(P)-dependent oxidoreductase [Chitinophaga rhizophila]|uniref:SDR family NAD(P)-dependent oxidoreductase n=1 Tax=Chitinophaga rhizophila TaxID=2866212 RepID=UPI001F2B2308|nr:SDR family NAD(P)-dependent oxidoreductase [Chitinophaga rhizophila]
MQKVWFITGSARGLGKSITAAVLAKGDLVVATARNPAQLEAFVQQYGGNILPLQLDVTDHQQVRAAVAAAIDRFGRIDVLVNNAGFGIIGAAEAFTDEQVRSQLETNLYAPIEITRVILPYMRKQRAGRIIQISSIGGRITSTGISIYQSAKWGLSGFAEALAKEVAPLGIKVTSVEPGGFRTDWAGDSMSYAPAIEGYETTIGERTEIFRTGKFVPKGHPDKAAIAITNLADHP